MKQDSPPALCDAAPAKRRPAATAAAAGCASCGVRGVHRGVRVRREAPPEPTRTSLAEHESHVFAPAQDSRSVGQRWRLHIWQGRIRSLHTGQGRPIAVP
jgi:hypothetical protein